MEKRGLWGKGDGSFFYFFIHLNIIVPYFNRKYGRIGHLFQDRYRSEQITDDSYLLGVVSYIHKNPEKAGICRMDEYFWSSFRDYVNGTGATEIPTVLNMFHGTEEFLEFMHLQDDTVYLEDTCGLSEKEAVVIAKELIPGDLFYLQHYINLVFYNMELKCYVLQE